MVLVVYTIDEMQFYDYAHCYFASAQAKTKEMLNYLPRFIGGVGSSAIDIAQDAR